MNPLLRRDRSIPRAPRAIRSRLPELGVAPELRGVHLWLNTRDREPLTLAKLEGRVVLIEFWTFACINCVRTLPFLRQMDQRYRSGLTVLGVHTPELPFERPVRNVGDAVRKRGLEFPVGLDNDYATWDAYGNHYWPSQYLVDAAGQIRYTHIGEGGYRRTEAAIGLLLSEREELNANTGHSLATGGK